ncbi:alpha/beta fold hydrolase [Streptomyces sp. NPDC005438]|uniref:alpha/beta fold hydrolase n=1 Tax=Streptomyces sp. NPDC005438 TaxID=3156880 RepID=UPI0033B0D398
MTDTVQPTEFTVPVRGGQLAVHHWPLGEGTPVIALHGIAANGRAFDALACHPLGAPLYAPDLRGRGRSQLPGPYGLGAHVEDTLALLDHLDAPRAVLVGHSMGAFIAALAASRHPERFPRVVLVDGGVGFPPPEGADLDEVLQAVLGPAMRRLSMTFPDPEAYRDFFRQHPALVRHWGPDVQSYVDRDLIGPPGEMVSSCVLDAVRADGAMVLGDPETLAAVHQPGVRGTLLWAERGLLDEPQALYDADRIAAAELDPDRIAHRRIDDTNHYDVLLSPRAAREIADAVSAEREAV